MEAGLDGPDGDVEDDGHLRQRQIDVEVQDHHGPLIDRQVAQPWLRRSRSANEPARSRTPAGSVSKTRCSSTTSRRLYLRAAR